MLGDFPIRVAKDGTIIVALQWDDAAWTAGAASFTDDVQSFPENLAKARISQLISPDKSPHVCARN
jgi:hypothetical protein